MMDPGEQVAIVAIVFGTMFAIGFPLARAFARRIEGGRSAASSISPDLSERLDRIERAVESVALEVERISEGQRFVTKLMTERPEPGRLPGSSVQH
jgi:hypothetical protein